MSRSGERLATPPDDFRASNLKRLQIQTEPIPMDPGPPQVQ